MSKAANGSETVYKPKHPSKNLPFRAEVWITDNSRPEGKRRISKNFKKCSQAKQWRDEMIQKYSSASITRHNKKTDGTSVRKNMKNKNSGSKSSNFTDAFIEFFLMNGFGKNHTDKLSASGEK